MAALAHAGYNVLIPYGENSRYDAVIEGPDDTLSRVQIKTGRLRNGAIEFKGYSTHTHRGSASIRTYVGDVDFFGVYCPQLDRCFLIPTEQVVSHASLRVEPTRNGQTRGIRWASNYALVTMTEER